MKKMFWNTEKLEREWRIPIIVLIPLALWAICELIVWIVTIFSSNPAKLEMIPVGTLCMIMGFAGVKYFCFANFTLNYKLSIMMGRTRQSFLLADLFWEIIYNTAIIGVLFLLYKLELWLYAVMGIVTFKTKFEGFFHISNMISFGLFLSVITVCIAAIYSWNKWLPTVFWILFCLSIGKIFELTVKKKGLVYHIIKSCRQIPPYGIVLGSFFIVVLLWGISRKILLKQQL